MNLTDRYLNAGYTDYESMKAGLSLSVPENFNFGFDVVDEYARLEPPISGRWSGATIRGRSVNIPLRIFLF